MAFGDSKITQLGECAYRTIIQNINIYFIVLEISQIIVIGLLYFTLRKEKNESSDYELLKKLLSLGVLLTIVLGLIAGSMELKIVIGDDSLYIHFKLFSRVMYYLYYITFILLYFNNDISLNSIKSIICCIKDNQKDSYNELFIEL